MNRLNVWRRCRFLAGTALLLAVLAGCGGGGGGGNTTPPDANTNVAPVAVMTLSGLIESGTAGADIDVAAGTDLELSASGSSDTNGDALSYQWSIVSKPEASKLVLATPSSMTLTARPDVAGSYVLKLRVSDPKGAFTEKNVTVLASASPVSATSITIRPSFTVDAIAKPTQFLAVGATILLESNASAPTGSNVMTEWTLTAQPGASKAALVSGYLSRLVLDVPGVYKLRAHGINPQSAFSDTEYVFEVSSRAPKTLLAGVGSLSNLLTPGVGGTSTIAATGGSILLISGTAAIVPENGPPAFTWSLASKPAASSAVLGSAEGKLNQLALDATGDYVIKLNVSEGSSKRTETITVSVKNMRPLAVISTNAGATGPALRLPSSTQLTLLAGTSTDPDGNALSYSWTLAGKPAGSSAALSAASGASVQITPEVIGNYTVILRATDTAGAYSEQILAIALGNVAPVAVLTRNSAKVVVGSGVGVSASDSYDVDGDALSFLWELKSRPAGSTVTAALPTDKHFSFTPDVPGAYVASVTVSDGHSSSVDEFTVEAVPSTVVTHDLSFVPLQARYSRSLGKMVIGAAGPNALKLVDPVSGTTTSVALPSAVKALNLSPDGKLAAVLHEGSLSLVDIATGVLLRTSVVAGSPHDAVLSNAGLSYLMGHSGPPDFLVPATSAPIRVIDARTGTDLTATLGVPTFGPYAGNQGAVFASQKNRVLFTDMQISKDPLHYADINAGTGQVTASGNSSATPDYKTGAPLFLTENEEIVVAAGGNYFRTDTLLAAGKLSNIWGQIVSMSNHAATGESLVLITQPGLLPDGHMGLSYSSYYTRYQGAQMVENGSYMLPLVGGLQSYGIAIFHGATGKHVALVQTATGAPGSVDAKYHVIVR